MPASRSVWWWVSGGACGLTILCWLVKLKNPFPWCARGMQKYLILRSLAHTCSQSENVVPGWASPEPKKIFCGAVSIQRRTFFGSVGKDTKRHTSTTKSQLQKHPSIDSLKNRSQKHLIASDRRRERYRLVQLKITILYYHKTILYSESENGWVLIQPPPPEAHRERAQREREHKAAWSSQRRLQTKTDNRKPLGPKKLSKASSFWKYNKIHLRYL